LRLKIEASGWSTKEHEQNPELQADFCEIYHHKYGIEIDIDNVKPNPGMRTLAKVRNFSYRLILKL
jgi:hypothetical protein